MTPWEAYQQKNKQNQSRKQSNGTYAPSASTNERVSPWEDYSRRVAKGDISTLPELDLAYTVPKVPESKGFFQMPDTQRGIFLREQAKREVDRYNEKAKALFDAEALKPYAQRAIRAERAAQAYEQEASKVYEQWRSRIRTPEEIQKELDALTGGKSVSTDRGAGRGGFFGTEEELKAKQNQLEEELGWSEHFAAEADREEKLSYDLTEGQKKIDDLTRAISLRKDIDAIGYDVPTDIQREYDGILRAYGLSEGDDLQLILSNERSYYSAAEKVHEAEKTAQYIRGIMSRPDFSEKSKYVSTANGEEAYANPWMNNLYTVTGFDDIEYDYINKNPKAVEIQGHNDAISNRTFLGLDGYEKQHMTEDEIAVYNYLYATEGLEAAKEFLVTIASDLNYRDRKWEEEKWKTYADKHPVQSSAFSVLTSPMKGLSYLAQTADYLDDGELEEDAGYNRHSYINSSIRSAVSQKIEESGKWGKVGSFLYNTGMSMGDFLMSTAISGGNGTIAMTVMGTGAAADTVISSKDRGLSDGQAFTLGTIAGLAEAVTEKISLEALLNPDALADGAFKYVLKNMLAEGSEEAASDVINLFADILVSKDQSQWSESIRKYMKEGKTREEAFGIVFAEQAETVGLDFLGGVLSGGGMSGVSAGLNFTSNHIDQAKAKKAEKLLGKTDAVSQEDAEALPDWEKYEAEHAGERFTRERAGDATDQVGDMEIWRDNLYYDAQELTDQELEQKIRENESERDNTELNDKAREIAQYRLDALESVWEQRQNNNAALNEQRGEGVTFSGTEGINDSSQRNEGVGSRGPVGGLEEGAGRSVTRGKGKTETAILKDLRANASPQSAREIGIIGGSVEQDLYVIPDERVQESEQWSRIKADAEANGHSVVFVAGTMRGTNKDTGKNLSAERSVGGTDMNTGKGWSAEGIRQVDESGRVTFYIRTDKIGRSAEQIYKHEDFHDIVAGNPKLLASLVESLENRYTKQELMALINSYAEAYDGIYGEFREGMTETEEEALIMAYAEELFADAYAQINRGRRNTRAAKTVLADQTEAVQRAAQNRRATDSKTAPPEQKFSYGGENARTADRESLNLAKRMQDEGYSMEEIRQETGWHQGFEGKWRFEIDDSKMEYHKNGDARFGKMHPEYTEYQDLSMKFIYGTITEQEVERLHELGSVWGNERGRLSNRIAGGGAKLSDILSHDALYEAYPELANVSISFGETDGRENGYFDKRKNTIVISNALRNSPENTLLHEIQHAIQDIEGFASGASPEYWEDRLRSEAQREIEEADRRYSELWEALPEEAKTTIREINRAKLQEDWDRVLELEDALYESEYADLYSELSDADFDRRNLREREQDFAGKAMERYRNTAGEIEARDSASRRTLTPEERKKTSPKYGDGNTVTIAQEGWWNIGLSVDDEVGSDSDYRRGNEVDRKKIRGHKSVLDGNIIQLTPEDLEEYLRVGTRQHVRNEKKAIIDSGKSPILYTEREIKKFISDAVDGIEKNNIRAYGRVGTKMADDVKELNPSVDINGYYMELEANHMAHLSDHIESDSDVRNIPLTKEQAMRIPEFLDTYDDVLEVTLKKDGSVRIKFGKRVNGYSVIIQTVSKGRSSIHTRTAWVNTTEEYLRKYKKMDASATSDEASAKSGQDTGASDSILADDAKKVKQNFSIDDDVRELDEAYGRKMAEDEETAGLPSEEDALDKYNAQAREVKVKRAEEASVSTLRNRIKSGEKAVEIQQGVKDALRKAGKLTNSEKKIIDEKIKLIRETLEIDRKALREKERERKRAERKKAEEEKEEEIKNQKAKIAQKELRQDLMNLFSVPVGAKTVVGDQINQFSDKLLEKGNLSHEDRKELFDILMDHGQKIAHPEEYFENVRNYMAQGRIYVSESVRDEFGDDWKDFQRRAWGNRIYLTADETDMGIDVWTMSLQTMFGGQFSGENDLKSQLEMIVELAEEGKPEKLTVAEMMQREADEFGWSVEEQVAELESKVDKILDIFAQKADLEIRMRKQSLRSQMREAEERRATMERKRADAMENKARKNVMTAIQKMNKMRKRAAPEQRQAIDETLKGIDVVARSISARGLEDLQELKRLYLEQMEEQGANFLSSPYVEARLARLDQQQLDDMRIEDVVELGRLVCSITNAIQNSNKLLAQERAKDVLATAEQVDREIWESEGADDTALRKFALEHLNAKSFFGQVSGWVNGAFESLGKALSTGQERQMRYQMHAMRIFDGFLSKKENQEWLKSAAGKDARWITVKVPDGFGVSEREGLVKVSEIQITPMMRVSLLLHSMNEDNLRHIKTGGIRIPDAELYSKGKLKEAYAKGKLVKMEPATVRAIVKECDATEKAFARLCESYFNGMAKDCINEVSMLLDGFERAGGEHYYHIKTDPAFLAKQNDTIKRDLSVAATASVVNERKHASNPIVLQDATDALMEHIESISKYYGYSVPIRDLNAVLGQNFHKEDNAFSGSVMDTVKQKWGSSAEAYLDKIMADLQLPDSSKDLMSGFLTKIRGNYAKAVISANLSSLLKQTTSYPVALPYLKADGLLHGLGSKNMAQDVKTLERYSAVYWYRNQGNSTMELTDVLKSREFGDALPWVFNATQKMDSWTTRRILAACEYRVQKDKGLKPGTDREIAEGTDRYWTEVAKLFNDVVLKTQSNSTMMERPQITRANASNISRFLTMFRTDAFQQYNMLVEAFGRLRAAKKVYEDNHSTENGKVLKEARSFAARTVVGTVVGQTGCALVAVLLKMLRFDDEEFRDEKGDLKWGALAGYVGSSIVEGYCGFITCGEILYAAVEAIIDKDKKWWDLEVNALSAVSDSIEAMINAARALTSANWREGMGAVKDTALKMSKAFGIPVENLEKYLGMCLRWVAPEWVERYENFWDETTKADLKGKSRKLVDEAISVMMDNRTGGLSHEYKEEISRLYLAGGVGAIPTGIPGEISYTDEEGQSVEISLSRKQQEEYRGVWSEIVSGALGELLDSEAYRGADDEGKTELIDKLYKYANATAQSELVPEKELTKWVAQGDVALDLGVSLSDYIVFRVQISEVDGKDASGETVDGLKAQRSMELIEAMGWTDQQEQGVWEEVVASDSASAVAEALTGAGLSWDIVSDVVQMGTKVEKLAYIAGSKATDQMKVKAMCALANDTEKKLLTVGLKWNVKPAWYGEVIANANTDGKGGVSQKEAQEYIMGMDLSIQEKAVLFQMVTDAKYGKANPFYQAYAENFWYEVHEDDPE